MKKTFTLLLTCIALAATGMAQPKMANMPEKFNREKSLERNIEKQKPEMRQINPEVQQLRPITSTKPVKLSKGTDWYEPDTIITYTADNSAEIPEKRFIFTYLNGNYDTDLKQFWDGTQWVNKWYLIRSYDSKNNLTQQLYNEWEAGQLVEIQKNNYEYNANNDVIEATFAQNKWGTETLILRYKVNYEYDAQNNMIEEIDQEWDWAAEQLVNIRKFSYAYDVQNKNVIVHLEQVWENEQWVDCIKYSRNYDAQNNMVEEVKQERNWETGMLENALRWTCTYNNKNFPLEVISQNWNAELEEWINFLKKNYYYDIQDNIIEFLSQFWSLESNHWISDERFTAEFDTQNNMIEKIGQAINMEGVLENKRKDTYSYDGQNNLEERVTADWDAALMQWVNSTRENSTFNSQNDELETLFQSWEAGEWFDKRKNTYTYDDHHNTTSGITQKWTGNTWENLNLTDLLIWYNNHEIRIYESQSYNLFKFVASYVKLATVSVQENTFKNNVKLYPNPVSNILNIETDNGIAPEVKIYSMQGALLMNVKGNTINLSSLSSGIYIAEINGKSQKIVKL